MSEPYRKTKVSRIPKELRNARGTPSSARPLAPPSSDANLSAMCNAYRIGRDTRATPAVLPEGLLRDLSEDRLIRRTDRAPVYAGGSDLVTMRWGFERPGLGTVNNSREDKLDGPMWRKAFQERRCLVPVSYTHLTLPTSDLV